MSPFFFCKASSFSELYAVKDVYNPGFQRLYQCIQSRALGEHMSDLPPVNAKIIESIEPNNDIQSHSKAIAQELKGMFEIKKVIKKTKSAKRVWEEQAQLASREKELESALTGEKKKQKVGDDISDLFSGQANIESVGTTDPIADMKAMVARKDVDLVEKGFLLISLIC